MEDTRKQPQLLAFLKISFQIPPFSQQYKKQPVHLEQAAFLHIFIYSLAPGGLRLVLYGGGRHSQLYKNHNNGRASRCQPVSRVPSRPDSDAYGRPRRQHILPYSGYASPPAFGLAATSRQGIDGHAPN